MAANTYDFTLTFKKYVEDEIQLDGSPTEKESEETVAMSPNDQEGDVKTTGPSLGLSNIEVTETGYIKHYSEVATETTIVEIDTDQKTTTKNVKVTTQKKFQVVTEVFMFKITQREDESRILHYLTFNRKLYEPNEIVADIQYKSTPKRSELQELLGKRVELSYTGPSASGGTQSKTIKGFYVHDILPLYKDASGENLYVRLHIYSLDHQFTRKKFSRTYVAKKLFADILLAGTPTASGKKIFGYNMQPNLLACPFATFYDNKKKTLTGLNHLAYTAKGSSSKSESVQPYLVQYNESFYDFLVRTTNRCGEFLFWENNSLHLGRNTDKDTKPEVEIKSGDCLSVFYTSLFASQAFVTDYMTIDDQNDLASTPELNSSNVGGSLNPGSGNTKYYYNNEINHDVYRTHLYRDRFDSAKNQKSQNWRKHMVRFFSNLLREGTLFNLSKGLKAYEATTEAVASAKASQDNARDNKTYINSNAQAVFPFTTADTNGQLNNTFYTTIRKKEEELSRQLITFNIANDYKDLSLGDAIRFDGLTYVIVQIKMDMSIGESKFRDIDAANEVEFQNLGGAVMQVVAIPMDATGAYPPIHHAGHIRNSDPQVAFVADFKDPQQRGRVRIIYPWQHKSNKEASPWIRVLTPSATPGSGCSFQLATGDEVLVNYEAGNVERPYVAGASFNRHNAKPFDRGDMALISKNGHGIAFDDPTDTTSFSTAVSPAWNFVKQFIPLADVSKVGSIDKLKFSGGMTLSDVYGLYNISMSSDQRKIDISSPFGNVNIDAFTGITISAPNGDINIKGQNINIEAGNAVKITSGTNVRDKDYVGDFANLAKGPKAGLVGAGFVDGFAEHFKPFVNTADLNLLRKMMETFLRPIDGTMEIKSYKYMFLEAGDGEATIQPARYNTDSTKYTRGITNARSLTGIKGAVEVIDSTIDQFVGNLECQQQIVNDAVNAFDAQRIIHIDIIGTDCLKGKDIVKAAWNNGTPEKKEYKTDTADFCLKEGVDKEKLQSLVDDANDLAVLAFNYFGSISSASIKNTVDTLVSNPVNAKCLYYDKIRATAEEALHNLDQTEKNLSIKWEELNNSHAILEKLKVNIKRQWFNALWQKITEAPDCPLKTKVKLCDDASNWDEFVGSIEEVQNAPDQAMNDAFTGFGQQYYHFGSHLKKQNDRAHWEADKPGQIIFSDQSNHSFYFDRNGVSTVYMNRTVEDDNVSPKGLMTLLYGWADNVNGVQADANMDVCQDAMDKS